MMCLRWGEHTTKASTGQAFWHWPAKSPRSLVGQLFRHGRILSRVVIGLSIYLTIERYTAAGRAAFLAPSLCALDYLVLY